MSLEKDQAAWEHFGREDPLWAVCTDAGRRHGGWDDAAFFLSGLDFAYLLATKRRWREQAPLPQSHREARRRAA